MIACRISTTLRVLHVASEVTPFAMTGGLGDVTAALPMELGRLGIDSRIVVPLYRCIDRSRLRCIGRISVPLGAIAVLARVWVGALRDGTVVYFVEHDPFFARDGIYGTPAGDHPDNLLRFAFFSRASLEIPRLTGWIPHVVHAHDWPAALVPIYLTGLRPDHPSATAGSVLTIHNLAFQGAFEASRLSASGLGDLSRTAGLVEHGYTNLLRAGIAHATRVTTVSPSYAREIQTPEFGCGLDPLLRSRSAVLTGILNGIDTEDWDPRADRHLAACFGPGNLAGKAACKAELQREGGLEVRADVPLIGVVARLTHQKGIDLIAGALPRILETGAQLVVLGAGDAWAEQFFRQVPSRGVRAWTGTFDTPLAHRIEAGADLFLMPSRYEPCGLNQMYSMRYGTLPIVRATGGLHDTVTDGETGFKFGGADADSVAGSVERAVGMWKQHPDRIARMRATGMLKDFSWSNAATAYEDLYEAVRDRLGTMRVPPGGPTRLLA